jgi:hypothetical protein
MTTSIIINALIEKRRELAGIVTDLEKKIAAHRNSLSHVDATLRLFAPDMKVSDIKGKTLRACRSDFFRHGEITARCQDAIRDSGGEPVSAEQIAVKALRDKALDPDNARLRSEFIRRVLWSLSRMEKVGKVQRIGKGVRCRWTAA